MILRRATQGAAWTGGTSGIEVMDRRRGEGRGRVLGGAEAVFELVAEGREGVHVVDDSLRTVRGDAHRVSAHQYLVRLRAPVFSTSGCEASRFATVC